MSPQRGKPLPPGLAPYLAPGSLRLVQDFVNTEDVGTGRDALAGPRELGAWLAMKELAAVDERLSDEDWRHARDLRQGLRELIRSHNRGARLDFQTIERLNGITAQHLVPHRILFQPDGLPRLVTETPGWSGALLRLAAPIVEAVREGWWDRLKECHSETCRRIFFDRSRNRRGKWCNPRRCGNRAHTKTYRKRKPTWARK